MSLYHVLFREVSYYVWAFYACFLRGAFSLFSSVVFLFRSFSFPSVFFVRISDKINLGILYIDLTVIDSVARLELFTSCHYGCLGDHEGMGANRWAPSHDSVGEALF